MTEPARRFPAPWRADKIPGGYVVRDANGQALDRRETMTGLLVILVLVAPWVIMYLLWWFFAEGHSLSGAHGPRPDDRLFPWSKPRWLARAPRGVKPDPDNPGAYK
jgi:hypothetical protein